LFINHTSVLQNPEASEEHFQHLDFPFDRAMLSLLINMMPFM